MEESHAMRFWNWRQTSSVAGLSVMTLETLRYFHHQEIPCSRHKIATISLFLRHPQMLGRNRGRERSKQRSIAEKEIVFMFGKTSLELPGTVPKGQCYI